MATPSTFSPWAACLSATSWANSWLSTGALENALVAGSDAQATGSIARVKDICQKCHDQKWSK